MSLKKTESQVSLKKDESKTEIKEFKMETFDKKIEKISNSEKPKRQLSKSKSHIQILFNKPNNTVQEYVNNKNTRQEELN